MGYHFRAGDTFVRIIELTPQMRKRIEATIEHLLSILDAYDGDENLEDDGCAEPWLSTGAEHHQTAWRTNICDDREVDDYYDEYGGDYEPTLGWTVDGFVGPTAANDARLSSRRSFR